MLSPRFSGRSMSKHTEGLVVYVLNFGTLAYCSGSCSDVLFPVSSLRTSPVRALCLLRPVRPLQALLLLQNTPDSIKGDF